MDHVYLSAIQPLTSGFCLSAANIRYEKMSSKRPASPDIGMPRCNAFPNKLGKFTEVQCLVSGLGRDALRESSVTQHSGHDTNTVDDRSRTSPLGCHASGYLEDAFTDIDPPQRERLTYPAEELETSTGSCSEVSISSSAALAELSASGHAHPTVCGVPRYIDSYPVKQEPNETLLLSSSAPEPSSTEERNQNTTGSSFPPSVPQHALPEELVQLLKFEKLSEILNGIKTPEQDPLEQLEQGAREAALQLTLEVIVGSSKQNVCLCNVFLDKIWLASAKESDKFAAERSACRECLDKLKKRPLLIGPSCNILGAKELYFAMEPARGTSKVSLEGTLKASPSYQSLLPEPLVRLLALRELSEDVCNQKRDVKLSFSKLTSAAEKIKLNLTFRLSCEASQCGHLIYTCIVLANSICLARSSGTSKKRAKRMAADAAVHNLSNERLVLAVCNKPGLADAPATDLPLGDSIACTGSGDTMFQFGLASAGEGATPTETSIRSMCFIAKVHLMSEAVKGCKVNDWYIEERLHQAAYIAKLELSTTVVTGEGGCTCSVLLNGFLVASAKGSNATMLKQVACQEALSVLESRLFAVGADAESPEQGRLFHTKEPDNVGNAAFALVSEIKQETDLSRPAMSTLECPALKLNRLSELVINNHLQGKDASSILMNGTFQCGLKGVFQIKKAGGKQQRANLFFDNFVVASSVGTSEQSAKDAAFSLALDRLRRPFALRLIKSCWKLVPLVEDNAEAEVNNGKGNKGAKSEDSFASSISESSAPVGAVLIKPGEHTNASPVNLLRTVGDEALFPHIKQKPDRVIAGQLISSSACPKRKLEKLAWLVGRNSKFKASEPSKLQSVADKCQLKLLVKAANNNERLWTSTLSLDGIAVASSTGASKKAAKAAVFAQSLEKLRKQFTVKLNPRNGSLHVVSLRNNERNVAIGTNYSSQAQASKVQDDSCFLSTRNASSSRSFVSVKAESSTLGNEDEMVLNGTKKISRDKPAAFVVCCDHTSSTNHNCKYGECKVSYPGKTQPNLIKRQNRIKRQKLIKRKVIRRRKKWMRLLTQLVRVSKVLAKKTTLPSTLQQFRDAVIEADNRLARSLRAKCHPLASALLYCDIVLGRVWLARGHGESPDETQELAVRVACSKLLSGPLSVGPNQSFHGRLELFSAADDN